jgi:hypothetical protein
MSAPVVIAVRRVGEALPEHARVGAVNRVRSRVERALLAIEDRREELGVLDAVSFTLGDVEGRAHAVLQTEMKLRGRRVQRELHGAVDVARLRDRIEPRRECRAHAARGVRATCGAPNVRS